MLLKVLSIPADHPYPRALKPPTGWPDVTVLPDPVIHEDNPKQWWPHPAFEPTWWQQQTEHIDLVHVHFGFEHLTIAQTRHFTQLLQENNIPLVLTVHDLDNPHLEDQSTYHQQLASSSRQQPMCSRFRRRHRGSSPSTMGTSLRSPRTR